MPTKTISTDLREPIPRAGGWLDRLPVTRDLTLAYALSFLIAILVMVAVVASLLWPGSIYPTEEALLSFLPVDLFHLLIGLPVLLGSMALARRGRLAGLLCWPGALLYVLYSYITNLLGVPFGPLFLPYLLLVTLSAYTTMALVGNIDSEAVRRQLTNAVPARATAAVLAGLSGLFVVMNVSAILSALASQPPAEPQHPLFVLIADFTTAIPLGLLGGLLLWRRSASGYTAGAGLLLFYTMLFMALIPALTFPALYDGSPIAVADVVTMLACGLLCLWLLMRYVRGARRGG